MVVGDQDSVHPHLVCERKMENLQELHAPLHCTSATFHQGDSKFGETKGIQCSCITLHGIVYSVFKNIATWSPYDLEYVMEEGDLLFKSTGSKDYLGCLVRS